MKWIMPSFLTSLISIIAIACNNRFGWHLSPDKLIASVALTINFVIVTMSADIAKMKRGEMPNWNSTKLFTLVFACLMIGFSQYLDIELGTEEVLIIAGSAAAFITGKGIRDAVQAKQDGGKTNDPTQYKGDSGAAV